MDSSIHRMSVQQVLDHPVVPEEQKLALRCFLKSWYGKDAQGGWMRSQHGSKDAAALLASSFTCYPMGNRHLPAAGALWTAPVSFRLRRRWTLLES